MTLSKYKNSSFTDFGGEMGVKIYMYYGDIYLFKKNLQKKFIKKVKVERGGSEFSKLVKLALIYL